MTYDFLQETTSDWKTESRVPCHIYLMENSKCVGYIKEGTTKIKMFSTPWTHFDKRRRSFTKLNKKDTAAFTK